jgi:hypothetical protein
MIVYNINAAAFGAPMIAISDLHTLDCTRTSKDRNKCMLNVGRKPSPKFKQDIEGKY